MSPNSIGFFGSIFRIGALKTKTKTIHIKKHVKELKHSKRYLDLEIKLTSSSESYFPHLSWGVSLSSQSCGNLDRLLRRRGPDAWTVARRSNFVEAAKDTALIFSPASDDAAKAASASSCSSGFWRIKKK